MMLTPHINRPWDMPVIGPSIYTCPETLPPLRDNLAVGFVQSRIYDSGRYTHDVLDPKAVAEHHDSECGRHLYSVVILQTLLDACNPQYMLKGERHPLRYDAIEWIEGRTEDARNDRDEVLQLAGYTVHELLEGWRRIKEADYDLLKILDTRTRLESGDIIVGLTNDYSGIVDNGQLH